MANEEQVRQLAYELWEQAGRPHGLDLQHWFEAEVIAKQQDEQGTDKAKARRSRDKDKT